MNATTKLMTMAFAVGLLATAHAQKTDTNNAPTPAAARTQAFEMRQTLASENPFNQIAFRNIGPTVMSGRVVDIEVNPKNPAEFYVCYASGGLWHTENNGLSFQPLFDNQAVMTVGDVAVEWNTRTIWLGTGENNSSRSSYAGNGIYKSTDGGKTWQNTGLEESHHVGRIVVNPANPNIVWVAALGHLYSPNKERGVFITIDGGKTWKNTLFVNENSGAIDLVVDENNPNNLFAAIWERSRRAWNFQGMGAASGIHRSTDGGNTWQLVTASNSGFPAGDSTGRIGLAIAKSTIFAVVDNNFSAKKTQNTGGGGLTKSDLKKMTKDEFLKLDKKMVGKYLKTNDFPAKYSVEKVVEMVTKDEITPATLVDYTEDANAALTETNIVGAAVYRSDDNGTTWKRTHEKDLNNLFFTYGYYFSQIRVHPTDLNQIYLLGTRIAKSDDGGKTWRSINTNNVHWDHHALWIDPTLKGHLVNGNDGGINISYDDGKVWANCNSPAVGQFYAVNVDMEEPYNVYGGLQDNGVWFGSSKSSVNTDWTADGQNPFKSIMGGDGMQIAIDPRDNKTVYTGYQFGNYARLNVKDNESPKFFEMPDRDLGERPYRFNWQTPIHLSKHNADILYFAGNKVFRSLDKGDKWETISPDLTKGGIKGNVPFGTVTALHESPLRFGLLYAGTDDGQVHMSKDAENWKNISAGLPTGLWVSRIQASAHDKATVYVSLNGYRSDDFGTYLYVSKNHGENWIKIGKNLPTEPINVVREDPKNANILYVGTDHGLYISADKGETFFLMNNNLPPVAVHDLVIHPKANEIVVGTHGRSIYIADVSLIQSYDDWKTKNYVVKDFSKLRNRGWGRATDFWTTVDTPRLKMTITAAKAGSLNAVVKYENVVLRRLVIKLKEGINYANYDLTYEGSMVNLLERTASENRQKEKKDGENVEFKVADDGKFYLPKGKYKIEFEKDGKTDVKELIID
ncbi:MAG: hypothetical protein RL757_2244 [Bacteroidota bacterium]|jgi:photosystem II stability/assembly factor-like uncharacterized protein